MQFLFCIKLQQPNAREKHTEICEYRSGLGASETTIKFFAIRQYFQGKHMGQLRVERSFHDDFVCHTSNFVTLDVPFVRFTPPTEISAAG